ncbi:hypothetical protein SAMN02745220_00973 [Desulfopila aestuarii DSM 18488]|uniref:Uncharacterized protein n=1 Tax=Desulfopila aestuarii DSM 18488 TaxID=1121416 RepID=A0A1M7Y0M8_9BACT|nr:hypothetical protein SAMN02745220_00973 [Desulfopila aestuarii DSM 18488]
MIPGDFLLSALVWLMQEKELAFSLLHKLKKFSPNGKICYHILMNLLPDRFLAERIGIMKVLCGCFTGFMALILKSTN